MRQVMVRYKVKAGRAAENEAFITAVYEQLAREGLAGFRYATIKLEDGLTFMHIVSDDRPDGPYDINTLSAFKAFTANIRDRCDEPPVTTKYDVVGSYRLFTD